VAGSSLPRLHTFQVERRRRQKYLHQRIVIMDSQGLITLLERIVQRIETQLRVKFMITIVIIRQQMSGKGGFVWVFGRN
jgi:hypothetical protein